MAVLIFLFVLSLANVCLGYAIAVYLGYGLPSLRDAWRALGGDSVPPDASGADPIRNKPA